MEEFFIARWNGTFTSSSAWESQLRRAEQVLSQGKAFLGVAQGPRGDQSRMRFALASYLLVAGRGAHFRYADADVYDQAWLYDGYRARLGNPTGGRYQSGGLWRCDFARGSVTVDIARRTGTMGHGPPAAWLLVAAV